MTRQNNSVAKETGFTLIEALVALMIASTALVVLMGRLGSSANIQHSLAMQDMATDAALNKLTELTIASPSLAEQQGIIDAGDMQLEWRSWSEKTMLDGFMRFNVSVKAPDEPKVSVFVYREVR
ncbi:MAG: type II secretion system protein [Mariprofundus sp.]|nr:type II secretion system protein [Mariprofundus sp.]